MLILERANIVTTFLVLEAFRAVQLASQVFLNLIKVGYIYKAVLEGKNLTPRYTTELNIPLRHRPELQLSFTSYGVT